MYLKHKKSGDLVEVLDLDALFDPFKSDIRGRFHAGEELPEPAGFRKAELIFPSGEKLPRCWVDAHYHDTGR
ncbi:MAG: acetyltransferase [Candidatus Muproteobacteria bacterium RIFCSPHIGHO2_01_FULL_65_16]|uniref:Acetyltransferase n=3 Tax=Candidatus Muproteobacteria TaxID=1817795 RepID=A0A1F6TGI4_9PROT|nr:MAG: acetyltransferase [Candidatus Muproteobacteria bacterium RBG_16_65_31]OGI45030.1 MAG: acetyltransferase [Candidatus Muproteobacteria bacterium RIFCSPHIGHO2_01_FULL_65_16]OGI49387.1 MAG: acetyltransferase [Candidatus Muproteobacteria bacterium RIFCSPHIGHO2_02_FULL_65_16]